jgi:MFS-type transporter involved in bile tolerance (Atg22 family)
MQLALNTYFVTLGVRELGLTHLEAGVALACAQAGGLLGRLGWGFLAMRIGAARLILVSLGLGMAVCAATFGLFGDVLGKAGQYVLAAAFGLTASGWNGVFLAEVARLAPQDRIAETTGAVLTASYAGLLVTPAFISIAEPFVGLPGAFVGLAILAFGGTIALTWGDTR